MNPNLIASLILISGNEMAVGKAHRAPDGDLHGDAGAGEGVFQRFLRGDQVGRRRREQQPGFKCFQQEP